MLAVGTYRQVKLWDVASRMPGKALEGQPNAVRCLAWSADGKRLAAGGGNPGETGAITVWSPGEAAGPPIALKGARDVVEGVAFSPTGDALLSAGDDEKAVAAKLPGGEVLRAMTDHTNRVVSVAVSPSGKYVATGSLDKTVKIWSGADYKPLANLDNTGGQVYTVAFLPQGEQVVAAGEDGNVRIFRLSESRSGNLAGVNANLTRTLNGNRTPVLALAVAPKGTLLACGGTDRTVRVIDWQNGRTTQTLKDCPDAVYSLAFSPDGATLAAGCRDGKVRLWNTADGRLLGEL